MDTVSLQVAAGTGAALPPIAALDGLRLASTTEAFLLLSALSFLPLALIALTTFTRNIIVLSFVRQALGLQQTPPNIVLIALSAFLALFSMAPVFSRAYAEGVTPYLAHRVGAEQGAALAWQPFREFLLSQTRESDLALIHTLAHADVPKTADAVKPVLLLSSFMLSELKTAFQIGFVILLPFVLIDLVVAAVLMSLGMIMVPPATLALPIKILLFVVIDGWSLIARTLLSSVIV